jgi:hypothetical protein
LTVIIRRRARWPQTATGGAGKFWGISAGRQLTLKKAAI